MGYASGILIIYKTYSDSRYADARTGYITDEYDCSDNGVIRYPVSQYFKVCKCTSSEFRNAETGRGISRIDDMKQEDVKYRRINKSLTSKFS